MNNTDAIEQAYRNGYEGGKRDAVKHGTWIYHECVSSYEGAISGYSCSVCSVFVDEEIFDADVHACA